MNREVVTWFFDYKMENIFLIYFCYNKENIGVVIYFKN